MNTAAGTNRHIPLFVLCAFLAVLSGCSRYGEWDIDLLRSFFSDNDYGSQKHASLPLKLKLVSEKTSPDVWRSAFRHYGRKEFSLPELKGIVRAVLFSNALAASDQAGAEISLELLKTSLGDTVFSEPPVLFPAPEFKDSSEFKTGLLRYLAGLTLQCLYEIDAHRLNSPHVAGRRLTDLRGLLLALPESESSVPGITGILFRELDNDVNSIALYKIRDLLKGAYPGFYP